MKNFLLLVLFTQTIGFCNPIIGPDKDETEVIKDYLNSIKVADPIEYKNLRIFPIITEETLSLQKFVTLDEAVDKDWLKIREVGSGEVNFVKIKNSGKEMVFILTGEIITGAKQDRMIKEDILLPPKSGWVKVPVYCVEQGRWASVSPEFKSAGVVVQNEVRQRAKHSENQTEVWASIRENQAQLGVVSPTGTAMANYADEKVAQEVNRYSKELEEIPKLSKSTIGVVATTGNKIICFDLFANNGLLVKLWKKLIKSYAMDAITSDKSAIDKDDIAGFLEIFDGARYVATNTPGLGQLFAIEANGSKGSALVYDKAIVHMDFFPSRDPIPEEPGLRLDFRRNRRIDE